MDLNISFFENMLYDNGSGSKCFPGDTPLLDDYHYEGPFGVWQDRDGTAHATFYFSANGTNDTEGHKYVLHLMGGFVPDIDFPLMDGGTAIMVATHWEMSTEGRGQDRKNTCTGDHPFDTDNEVRVLVTRTLQ